MDGRHVKMFKREFIGGKLRGRKYGRMEFFIVSKGGL